MSRSGGESGSICGGADAILLHKSNLGASGGWAGAGLAVGIVCLGHDQEWFMSWCCASVSLFLRVGITPLVFFPRCSGNHKHDVAVSSSTVCQYPPCVRTPVQSWFETGHPKPTP